jgi:ribonuclease BN (tRNA processing enzyme)
MSGVELVVLGAGSILPRAGYGCSGYALVPAGGAGVTLLDCGPGSVRALGGASVELEQVRRVLVSHFHPDHCLDLLALAFARRNPRFDEPPPLELIGPRGLRRLVEAAEGVWGGWVRHRGVRLTEVEPTEPGELERDGARLAWAPTGHTPDAVAWRVEHEGAASLCYTGDSPESPEVERLAAGVDLLVAECSFPDDAPVEGHLTPSSAARMARAAGARRLLLTHFYPDLDPAEAGRVAGTVFDGPVELARDGSRHALAPSAR